MSPENGIGCAKFTCDPSDRDAVPFERLARETGHVRAQAEPDHVNAARIAIQRHHVHDQYGQLSPDQLCVSRGQRVRRTCGPFFPVH